MYAVEIILEASSVEKAQKILDMEIINQVFSQIVKLCNEPMIISKSIKYPGFVFNSNNLKNFTL